jgi:hypothetical protein
MERSMRPASEAANRASMAQLAQRSQRSGFYVVNGRTGLAVAGPYEDQGVAVRQAEWENGLEDAPLDRFEVQGR